jgi:hypothetical protein
VQAAAERGVTYKQAFLRDGTPVQVPLGADQADIAGPDGVTSRYEIKWAQDEDGNLQVLDLVPIAAAAIANGNGANGVNGANGTSHYAS